MDFSSLFRIIIYIKLCKYIDIYNSFIFFVERYLYNLGNRVWINEDWLK